MSFTEAEILEKLDFVYRGIPTDDYPQDNLHDIKYNFFLDVEHGYCVTASSKIHLYANENNWAIVFEKCGYFNRGYRVDIELDYIGNCIKYVIDKNSGNTYISNSAYIPLITSEAFESIRNTEGEGLEDFELISPDATETIVRGKKVTIEQDTSKYVSLSIYPRDFDNPKNLVGYDDIVRFYSETDPVLVSATEPEIRQYIPFDIPKLMALDKFHIENSYAEDVLPSKQELYQLIAKVLVTKNTSNWKPTLPPNSHWSNWESGCL